ncbi:MAG: hypothetical protein ACKVZJ_06560 [Phycisphaerales bacterium]
MAPSLRSGLGCAALALFALVASCKSTPKTAPAPDPQAQQALIAPARADNPTGTDTTSPYAFPLVDRARGGLEVQWWVADDREGAVGSALFDLADGAAPLPAAQARALIDNGLRLVRVRLDALVALQDRLPAVRNLERTWFGGVLDYKPLFIGRRIGTVPAASGPGDSLVLLIDGKPERVPPGVLRLIGRAWAAPGEAGDVLRFEAAVQLQTSSRDDAIAALKLKAAGPRGIVEEGRVFSSLSIETALTPGYAYVVAPESPAAEWRGTSPRDRARAEAEEAPERAGPVVRPTRTIGEAMMSFDPGEAGGTPGTPGAAGDLHKRKLKAVLVLIPR